jgi:hypothetical protein
VDENTLSAALDRAGLIFQDAGVKLTWLQCSTGSAQMVNFPVTLALRIIREPASGFVSRNALGFAVAAQGGAVYAAVFRNPLLAMSSGGRCSEAVLLGHAIAHDSDICYSIIRNTHATA